MLLLEGSILFHLIAIIQDFAQPYATIRRKLLVGSRFYRTVAREIWLLQKSCPTID